MKTTSDIGLIETLTKEEIRDSQRGDDEGGLRRTTREKRDCQSGFKGLGLRPESFGGSRIVTARMFRKQGRFTVRKR
ncbi:hypothetical protein U1Q18_010078, partial [Sarracenia purpurea var. burkii]